MNNDDGAWFLPKAFGYGAGLPIRWQGWALLGLYMLVVFSAAFFVKKHSLVGFFAILIVATAVMLPICAAKTRGGWHWR